MAELVGGVIYLYVDGVQYSCAGEFTYNLGAPKRELKVGHSGVDGYTEMPQAARIEGEITDRRDLDLDVLLNLVDATVTLELATGRDVVLRNAVFTADGDVTTEKGNIQCKFEGERGDRV